jgi:hypothetical protein
MKERFQRHKWWMVTMLLTLPVAALATGVTNVFSPGTVISSAAVNQNFQQITDRLTALENASGTVVNTGSDGGVTQCGPANGTWVMLGEYADDDADEYSESEFGYDEVPVGAIIDYRGALPRKVMFQSSAIAGVWNSAAFAFATPRIAGLIAPLDGTTTNSGASLLSATVLGDTVTNKTAGKCQRTQTLDLAFLVGGTVVHEQDAVVMTASDNGAAWNVSEFFTNSAGATLLTSYQWQAVPAQPPRAATGP